ncbi:MAG: F0F1 ATP synthase subunit A [Bacteroidia bacterium]|nr:F0F1 ATP synthase subunit A [Bacteroidia bacterium]
MNTVLNSRIFIVLAFLGLSFSAFAGDPDHHSVSADTGSGAPSAAGHGSDKLDVGAMILHHVLDAHEWHLWGEGEHSVSVPLPVILWTDKGLDVFLSSAFHHGTATVEKKYAYRIEHEHIYIVDETGLKDERASATLIDLSVTKNVASIFVAMILMILIFRAVAKGYVRNKGKAPTGIQSFFEPLIIFVRDDVARPNIGEKKYEKYMPFLLTAFFFIWISNMMGLVPLIPGGANVTGNISVTLVLACITFLITLFSSNGHYWRHILAMPGVPVPVLFILTPLEILGMFIRPLVLMLRLFANITAGHIVILSFVSLIFVFGEMSSTAGYGSSVLSVFFVLFMSLLELLVAFLQAYVFTLLSAIYIGAAVEEGHHAEHH